MSANGTLTYDVERALQHAVGHANNAYQDIAGVQNDIAQSSNRKKRAANGSGEPIKPKKRKKTGNNNTEQNKHERSVIATESDTPVGRPKKRKGDRNNPQQAGPPATLEDQFLQLPIDPALTHEPIHSTQPTNQLVDAVQRGDFSASSLQDLFGTSGDDGDDLLRILSEIDIPKIAGLLKNFGGEPFDGPNMNTSAAGAGAAATVPAKKAGAQKGAVPGRVRRPPPPSGPTLPLTEENSHAHLLANKWINTSKLRDLEIEEGLRYKKGKFSAAEDAALDAAISGFRDAHNLTDEDILGLIKRESRAQKTATDNSFWFEITSKLESRPVIAVYHHVRRNYDSKAFQGKWTEMEDQVLESSFQELGPKWEVISERVGRTSGDCRDRWRNHINHRAERNYGTWNVEEERELTRIVHSLTVNVGRSPDEDVFWSQVSNEMKHKRTRQQCRIKWYDALNKTVKNNGERPRWTPLDAYILVYKVGSLNINDDTEIDWKTLSDQDWNLWSPHQLQRRWKTLRKGIKDHESMAFKDIIDFLKSKKGEVPPQVVKKVNGKRHISAQFVSDEDSPDPDASSVKRGD